MLVTVVLDDWSNLIISPRNTYRIDLMKKAKKQYRQMYKKNISFKDMHLQCHIFFFQHCTQSEGTPNSLYAFCSLLHIKGKSCFTYDLFSSMCTVIFQMLRFTVKLILEDVKVIYAVEKCTQAYLLIRRQSIDIQTALQFIKDLVTLLLNGCQVYGSYQINKNVI